MENEKFVSLKDSHRRDYALVTGVNLAGFFWPTQRAIGQMLKQRSGHVVNISASIADRADSVEPTALTALTKGGLAAVTKSLAVEYASRGIRVNAVAPGIIQTPLQPAESYTPEALAGKLPPLGRAGLVSDIVEGILYLESAPYVTGEILHIDGGRTALSRPTPAEFGAARGAAAEWRSSGTLRSYTESQWGGRSRFRRSSSSGSGRSPQPTSVSSGLFSGSAGRPPGSDRAALADALGVSFGGMTVITPKLGHGDGVELFPQVLMGDDGREGAAADGRRQGLDDGVVVGLVEEDQREQVLAGGLRVRGQDPVAG